MRQVDFAYGDRLALKGIDMDVAEGSILGIIGPNGGGKSTLLKILIGRLTATRGQAQVAGLSPRQAVRRGGVVGYVPQNLPTRQSFPLTVAQWVRLGLAGKAGLFSSYAPDDLAFVPQILSWTGLAELADCPVAELSGGQLQRAAIARALVPRPRVLLLDEPTTGIDPAGQEQFDRFLRDLRDRLGLTVLLVSHDLPTVRRLCSRLACLNLTLHFHDNPHDFNDDLARHLFGGPAPANQGAA